MVLVNTDKQATFTSLANWYGIADPQKQEGIYKDIAKLPAKPYPPVEGIMSGFNDRLYKDTNVAGNKNRPAQTDRGAGSGETAKRPHTPHANALPPARPV